MLERKGGHEGDEPGHRHDQRTGGQKGDEYPFTAPRALEMIKQQWQHQQFDGRAYGSETRIPRSVGPQGSNERQRKEGDRQGRDRTRQRLQKRANLEREGQRDNPESRNDDNTGRRPGQQEREQDRKQVDVQNPRGWIVPRRQNGRNDGNIRLSSLGFSHPQSLSLRRLKSGTCG